MPIPYCEAILTCGDGTAELRIGERTILLTLTKVDQMIFDGKEQERVYLYLGEGPQYPYPINGVGCYCDDEETGEYFKQYPSFAIHLVPPRKDERIYVPNPFLYKVGNDGGL
ncbi:MAG: hypothetical protein GXO63_01750 [Candidatus Micrarchaeota archaeon]|nr:hypothetical protein [Candidatus Micrarchaeota archaeon]